MEKVKINANDRIIFGTSVVFLFKNEDSVQPNTMPDTLENPITYEFAINEINSLENAES